MSITELHEDMTTREVAQHYGVESRDVVYAARRGRFGEAARKMGWQWFFNGPKLPEIFPVAKRGGKTQ